MVEKDKQGKAQGALLGTAIADALGWPFEFNSGNQNPRNIKDDKFISWKRKSRYPFWHAETIEKGSYSDDTQLMLAIARCLMFEDWKNKFTNIEYPFWLEYERGAGRAVKKAASLWKKGIIPWQSREYCTDYFNAGGNGGAMRIAPHVIKKLDKEVYEIIEDVIDDVIISHGHPRAILGATCYSYALYYLFNKCEVLSFAELVEVLVEGRRIWGAAPNCDRFKEWLEVAQNNSGYNYSKVWNDCYTNMILMFEYIKKELNSGLLCDDKTVLENIGAYSKVSGAGDIAVIAAVYFFSKYVNTPELAISIPAFSIGIDTDTIASMTGGLIGAFCGSDWIPLEWKEVQDYSYISSVALDLCTEKTLILNRPDDLFHYLIGGIDKLNEENSAFVNSKYSTVKITKYKTSFGQTLFIKTNFKNIEKIPNKIESNNNQITLNILKIERILKDESLSRITLKKTFEILLLKSQGIDEKKIVKQVRVDKEIVSKVIKLFMG